MGFIVVTFSAWTTVQPSMGGRVNVYEQKVCFHNIKPYFAYMERLKEFFHKPSPHWDGFATGFIHKQYTQSWCTLATAANTSTSKRSKCSIIICVNDPDDDAQQPNVLVSTHSRHTPVDQSPGGLILVVLTACTKPTQSMTARVMVVDFHVPSCFYASVTLSTLYHNFNNKHGLCKRWREIKLATEKQHKREVHDVEVRWVVTRLVHRLVWSFLPPL